MRPKVQDLLAGLWSRSDNIVEDVEQDGLSIRVSSKGPNDHGLGTGAHGPDVR
jgi:hypothetical protein